LRDYLGDAGGDLEALPWRRMGGPVSGITLSRPGAPETLRLLRIKAGAAVPRHTHAGTELVMVLAGGFKDHVGQYLRGDVSVCDGALDHQPVADADGDCICLSVTDAPLRFTGPLGPLLNLFVKF
jgi:putative transcriptional regulator